MRVVKQAEERRDDILTAAMMLFSSQEYESVTMKRIMDELGIAKGTIYHYFPSKQALLEGVVDRIIDEELSKRQLLSLHEKANEKFHTRALGVYITPIAPLFAQIIERGCSTQPIHWRVQSCCSRGSRPSLIPGSSPGRKTSSDAGQ